MKRDIYGNDLRPLKEKKLFLFDMDGTIYEENRLFDGVPHLLESIVKKGARYIFITNNSSKSVKDYVKKLRGMGVRVTAENFFTSGQAAIMLLQERFGRGVIYAQATKSFYRELKKSGLNVVGKFTPVACAVLVGFDPEITGKKLRTTCEMLTKFDLPYYATNPDWVCPVSFGYIPDCGSMCFGIEKATGKRPVYIGKPQPAMIETVMKKYGVPRQETVVLGDRLYTDIASGVNAGVDTVCVLSGESKEEDIVAGDVKPTYVLHSVSEIEL